MSSWRRYFHWLDVQLYKARTSDLQMQTKPAWQAGDSYLGNFERYPILLAKLLKLSQHTGCKARGALSIQAIHHALDQIDLQRQQATQFSSVQATAVLVEVRNATEADLVFDSEVDEVGVNQDTVRRPKLRVVAKK